LHSDLSTGTEPNSNATYVIIFTIIAFLILFIACINFVNLSTARSAKRAREVGIRKVVGSQKSQLIKQFLGESIIFAFFSLVLALLFIQIFLPYYRHLTGKSLLLPYLENVGIIPGLIGLTLFVGLISGIYPALFLSSYRPVCVLKSSIFTRRNKEALRLRNGLVIFQFSMSALLIIGTIVIYDQLEYIRNKRLGFNKDHVIVIHNANKLGEQSLVLKQRLLQYSGTENATSSRYIPGKKFSNLGIDIAGIDKTSLNMTLDVSSCDHDFCNTLKMELAEGRFFSQDFPADTSAIVINEETVHYFGLTNPLGKHIYIPYREKDFQIIGVIKNIHYKSLHKKVKRMGLVLPKTVFSDHDRYIFARVKSENISETLDYMKKAWDSLSSGLPFEYSFLDEELEGLYNQEINTGKIVASFSSLAILISCLGIFGLAAFLAEQRTREIGIRKILGAKLSDVIVLLIKDFMKWIFIANLVVWPVGFFIMNRWLENFAYRINIGIEVFLLTGGLAVSIAIMTISYQVTKAATANPADSLRYE
jgi:putative ABC transport system permease protein